METAKQIDELLQKYFAELPHFEDGRINYSDSGSAVIIAIFVVCEGEVLILRRSDKVRTNKRKWNSVAGYLDRVEPIVNRVYGELEEELGFSKEIVTDVCLRKMYSFKDEEIGITWHVCPVRVRLKEKPEVRLDWEHTEYRWINPDEAKNFDTVPNFSRSLKVALEE